MEEDTGAGALRRFVSHELVVRGVPLISRHFQTSLTVSPAAGRHGDLLEHLVSRHNAPQIGGHRVVGPHLGTLRIIAMPWPRLEIAELLVHPVKLGEELSDQTGRTAMIREQVVADAVPAGSPKELVAVDAEEIARG